MIAALRDRPCSLLVCNSLRFDAVKWKRAEMQPHTAGHRVGVSVPCFGTRVTDTSSLAYLAAVTRLDCRRRRVTQRCPSSVRGKDGCGLSHLCPQPDMHSRDRRHVPSCPVFNLRPLQKDGSGTRATSALMLQKAEDDFVFLRKVAFLRHSCRVDSRASALGRLPAFSCCDSPA